MGGVSPASAAIGSGSICQERGCSPGPACARLPGVQALGAQRFAVVCRVREIAGVVGVQVVRVEPVAEVGTQRERQLGARVAQA